MNVKLKRYSNLIRPLRKKPLWIVIYAIYLTFILLSVHAFIAQESVDDIRANMDEKYDYYLVFHKDGVTTHYDVTRYNTNEPGKITLTYWTEANKLDITEVSNLKTLKIDVNSMFDDEVEKVFKKQKTAIQTMDMDYWFEAGDGIFTIDFDIAANEPLETLTFTKFPTPTSVLVNNQEWWKTNTNYFVSGKEITISNIPTGKTTVIIDFNTPNRLPVAEFTTDPAQKASVDQEVTFNGSSSYDPDGSITSWVWDFGSGDTNSGEVVKYSYSAPGTYQVKLTVRDNNEPFGQVSITKNFTVTSDSEPDHDSDNDGMDDEWEREHFGDLKSAADDDNDQDGYPNLLEYLAYSNPADAADFIEDYDWDGLPDKWEWDNFGNTDQGPNDDPDNDKISNLKELEAETDPNNPNIIEKGKDSDKSDSSMGTALIVIIIIIVVMIVVVLLIKKKKGGDTEPEHIEGVAPPTESQLQQPQQPEPVEQQPPGSDSVPPPVESIGLELDTTPSQVTQDYTPPPEQPPEAMQQVTDEQAQTQEQVLTEEGTGPHEPASQVQPETAQAPMEAPIDEEMVEEEDLEEIEVDYSGEPVPEQPGQPEPTGLPEQPEQPVPPEQPEQPAAESPPIAYVNCPQCRGQLAVGTTPCPLCGVELEWENI